MTGFARKIGVSHANKTKAMHIRNFHHSSPDHLTCIVTASFADIYVQISDSPRKILTGGSRY